MRESGPVGARLIRVQSGLVVSPNPWIVDPGGRRDDPLVMLTGDLLWATA